MVKLCYHFFIVTLCFGSIFLTGCGRYQQEQKYHQPEGQVYGSKLLKDTLDRGLMTITTEELSDKLTTIASDRFAGRGTGYTEELAAQYIEDKFAEFGITPGYHGSYRQKFSVNRGRGYTWNIVGYLPSNREFNNDEVVVIGGHYDHLGRRGDAIYNGADDNGSGTAAIIEIAEAFSEIRDHLRRTVVFIAFSAEEIGLYGSKYYVNNPLFPLEDTSYMINLDMIGWLRNKKLDFLGGGSSSYMTYLIEKISKRYDSITPRITDSAGGGSDHVPFIRKGVPAVFLHTGLHSVYHRPTDTAEKINYDGLTDVTKVAFELVWEIAQSAKGNIDWIKPEETPQWDLDHGVTPFAK